MRYSFVNFWSIFVFGLRTLKINNLKTLKTKNLTKTISLLESTMFSLKTQVLPPCEIATLSHVINFY